MSDNVFVPPFFLKDIFADSLFFIGRFFFIYMKISWHSFVTYIFTFEKSAIR